MPTYLIKQGDNTMITKREKELEQALKTALQFMSKGIEQNIYKECVGDAERYFNHLNFILCKSKA